jgi:4'-phosphopantetheinyl transferase
LTLRSTDEVHVWTAGTRAEPSELAGLRGLLATREQAQVDRLKFEAHRRRFIATRAIRRQILSLYTGVAPAELTFEVGERGKPELAGQGERGIHFNDSESDGVAVFAVSQGRRVGVDIESVREIPEAERLVESYASPRERGFFGQLFPPERQASFLPWWTAKEAYVKALGAGLFQPLDSFSITLTDGRTPRLLEERHGHGAEAGWYLESLEPAPGYVACVAVEGPPPHVTVRSWS